MKSSSHSQFTMNSDNTFIDLLEIRRNDCDILWVSRFMNPLTPHNLPPESKYDRYQIINLVLNNPQIKLAIDTSAEKLGVDRVVVEKKAWDIMSEMASKAHLPTVRWMALIITKVLKRIFANIYVNQHSVLNLRKQMSLSQVQYIYAPSHRSYLDFVLMSYILFSHDMALPNIASGMDFYHMKVIGEMLRKSGAFYMRRSFSDDQLYKEIFRAYITSLVTHSDRAIEFFIEGTRSRSQKSIVPKYGLLAMMLEGLFQGTVPDIQIIPISISYDRPLEELLFAYELLGVPKPKETTSGLFKSLSILQTPFAHGSVFFKIAEPISARGFIDTAIRKKKILYPHTKIPMNIVEDVAYSIIEAHKKNTVLTVFNLIALLFNENIQTSPGRLYRLRSLIEDYSWLKNILRRWFDSSICSTRMNDNVKEELLKSINTHRDLLVLDSTNTLRLKERHKKSKVSVNIKVRGHLLAEQTMQIAIPVINMMIYVNPALALVVKQTLIAATIPTYGIRNEHAFKKYTLLRSLLCTEFALPPQNNETLIRREWLEAMNFMIKENCVNATDELFSLGSNIKLYSILRNLILPFLDVIHIVCDTLLQWDNLLLGVANQKSVITECQKNMEKMLIEDKTITRHPYSLSVDVYSTTVSNLVSRGVIELCSITQGYKSDPIELTKLIRELNEIILPRPAGSYLDIDLLTSSTTDIQVSSKL